MLEVFINFICSLIMSLYGFYAIKKILKSNQKIFTIKNIIILSLLSLLTMLINNNQYRASNSIIILLLNILTYKYLFKIKLKESLLSCSIVMTIVAIGDAAITILFRCFLSLKEIKSNIYIYLITTILVIIVSILPLKIKTIKSRIIKFYKNITSKDFLSNLLFQLFILIGMIVLAFDNSKIIILTKSYYLNILVMIIFCLMTYLFIQNKNKYDDLNNKYEDLFTYVQNFEEWIEKEQLNRHEYKNQLAVLRCSTKDKKVKAKIDEILEDNINIEDPAINELKELPKGGIKGLMYYKAAIANKNKINLNINVSLNHSGILSKLSKERTKTICRLIGIYFDNAIEAAKETRKKVVLIEVYELKDYVAFVFSNTFKQPKNFENRNKKGISSKGKGRGNGLYFANKLINQNNWIKEKQEVIDKYYIEQIRIYKKA